MANINDTKVKFLRGLQSQLPKTNIKDGAFYLTTDTNRLYVGQGNSLALLNQTVKIVASQNELPSPEAARELTDFYYITNDNILAYWDGTKWTQINPNTTLVANNGNALNTTVTDNVATIELSVADTAGNAATGTTVIKSGSSNVSITKDTDNAISVAVAAPETVDFTIGTEDDKTENKASIVLRKSIGSEEATVDSTIYLTGNDFVTVESDADGNITIAADDQTITGVTNSFNANGELITSVAHNGKTINSDAITPIIKYGQVEVEAKFINGEADLDVYTIAEVNRLLEKYEEKANAMTYKGIIASYDLLPDTAETGDMYLLSTADGTYNEKDLFIWNGTSWDHVPSGDDVDTTYAHTLENNSLRIEESTTDKQTIFAVKSGNLITADGNLTTETTSGVTVDNLTITVNHNEVARDDADKGAKAQESKKTLTFDAVESITTDAYGHITSVKTNEVTVTDTHNTLTGAETIISSETNGVGLVTTVESADGNVSTDKVLVTSDSLAIGVKADATNTIVAELVWEAFA